MAKLSVPIIVDWESIKDYMNTHDIVEVVRCKYCKHRPEKVEESDEYDMDTDLEFPDEVCPCQCDDYYYSWMPKDDWFCASRERKEE